MSIYLRNKSEGQCFGTPCILKNILYKAENYYHKADRYIFGTGSQKVTSTPLL